MEPFGRNALGDYLKSLWGPQVEILRCEPIGKPVGAGDSKGFGYGVPLRIDASVSGHRRSIVLETMSANSFGHEHPADRAQELLWSHGAYNVLPRHVRSIDVGATRASGELVSLGNAKEFFIVTDFAEGEPYAKDLVRLRETGGEGPEDRPRAQALEAYLVGIHAIRGFDPGLYVRRIRELLGHGECIMGILDAYPVGPGGFDPGLLRGIERLCVDWRWKLKPRTHRLKQVHGDFHPWNILFRKGADFSVLDRSRGEWGDPADDVTCLTLNYALFSLERSGRLEGAFERLFRSFWDEYLAASGDLEILEVAAPFFTFRSLVMACPVWYPRLDAKLRRKLLAFARNVLEAPRFDPSKMNLYLEA